MFYSIIIPIHNEKPNIPALLETLEQYASEHEIQIVDDGSTDGSYKFLEKCTYINLTRLKNNSGKGVAIRTGLKLANNKKIVIFDGDMELNPLEIKKLMILDRENGIQYVFGSRYDTIRPFASLWDFGNFFFTGLFNLIHRTKHSDALCCAKAFYRDDINLEKVSANGFDIDVELASMLSKQSPSVEIIRLSYKRRYKQDGKKLNFSDGWKILIRIFKSAYSL